MKHMKLSVVIFLLPLLLASTTLGMNKRPREVEENERNVVPMTITSELNFERSEPYESYTFNHNKKYALARMPERIELHKVNDWNYRAHTIPKSHEHYGNLISVSFITTPNKQDHMICIQWKRAQELISLNDIFK